MDVSTSSEIDVIREENPASGKNGGGTQEKEKKGRKSTSNSQSSSKGSQKSSSSSASKKGKGSKKSNPGSSSSSGTVAEEKEVKANKNGKLEAERSSPDSSPTLKGKKKGSEDEETSGSTGDDKSSFPADLFEDTNAAERVKSASYRRQRKQVDRFAPSFLVRTNMMEEIDIPAGKGAKLQDISYIAKKINNLHVADLLKLHRFIFGRTGTHSVVKSHLLKFFGFDFDKESEEYGKKRRSLIKMDTTAREYFCDCLGLSKEGTQEEIVERILNFLLAPSADAITMDSSKDNKTEPNGRAKGQASPTKNLPVKTYKKNEKVPTEKVKKDSEPKTVIPLPQDVIAISKLETNVAATAGSKKQTKTTSEKKYKTSDEEDDTDGSASDTPSPPPKKKAPAKRKPKSALPTPGESKEQGQTSKKKKPAAKRKADKETDAEEGLTVSSPKKKRWNPPV